MPSINNVLLPSNYHNNAGLQIFKLAPVTYFSSENTFKSGFDWVDLESTENAGAFEITTQEDDNGLSYEIKCNGFFPGKDTSVDETFELLSRVGIICIAVDRDGNNRKIGNLQEPAEFRKNQFFTRGRPGTPEGTRYEITCQQRGNPPVFVF